jgi:hypothetical protein
MTKMAQESKQVKTLGEAISVLVQGVELGRAKGIYDWKDLMTISKSLEFLENFSTEQKEQSEQSDSQETE